MHPSLEKKIIEHPMLLKARELDNKGIQPYFLASETSGLEEVAVFGRHCINLSTTNYLGLSQDPRLKAAAQDAIERHGTSCTASRILSGTRSLHIDLEGELASFLGKDEAIVFPSGYLTNLGTIPALVGRSDAVIYDAEVHACLIDAIMLSGAKRYRFRHNSLEDLERKLERAQGNVRMVVVDSIYSMAGDTAPLEEIAGLCKKHDAFLFLDDAHGIGVLGRDGRGLADALGLTDSVDLIMGVFSKSFASVGGFVAGERQLVSYLRYASRTNVFSNALPPAQTAAALAALRLMETGETRPQEVLERAAQARSRLRAMGYRVGGDGAHLVPILVGDEETTLDLARLLLQFGVLTGPAISPGVPPGKSLLRIAFPPSLSEETLEKVFDAFDRAGRELGVTGSKEFPAEQSFPVAKCA